MDFSIVSLVVVVWLGCTSVPPHPEIDALESGFSGRMARAHLQSIARIYPRYPGSHEDSVARAYLAREFRLAGAEVRTLVEDDRRHLIAEFEGVSDDVVMLVAAYPSLQSGDWVDDSGAAILLELARVFGGTQPPYRLAFALAETRPAEIEPLVESAGSAVNWAPISSSAVARERLSDAGHSLARGIEAEGGAAQRVRAVLVFDTSAHGRRRFARDLRSHPEFRRLFWQSAADLGFDSVFPVDANWASPDGLHLGFRERSMDRVLVLAHQDVAAQPPTTILSTGDVSPGMFESIGAVSVEGLSRLMNRFEKVDDFSR